MTGSMLRTTFEDRLIATGGRPAGFDYLRISLAVFVIFFHSFDLCAGYNVMFHDAHGIFRPLDAAVLPMFFSLSGFLVAGSLERSKTLISFLGLRVIRLVPALLVETVLCAFIIGSIFTDLSLSHYFSNPEFARYFLNIIGDIHFFLPGVFSSNPFPHVVNGQLWTIPWELKCYISIALLSLIGATRKKGVFLALVLSANFILIIHHYFFSHNLADHSIADGSVSGERLVFSFLYGILFYVYRSKVIWNKYLFVAIAVAILVGSSMPLAFWGDSVTPGLFAYVTVYLGLLEPQRLKIISSGDYSYGMYLYGFPIEQAIIATLGKGGMHWYVVFPLAICISAVLAYFSWHAIEKHASHLRPWLFGFEKRVVARLADFRRTRLAGGSGVDTARRE
ncbi:acyltransferase family protein [Robbsia andropogonis]|nr:acyltransferase [Robbsia andropogonis]